MKTHKTKPARLVLWVQPHEWKDRYDESAIFKLCILRVDPKDDKPRNCSRDSTWNQEPNLEMFDDLKLTCYMSWRDGKFETSFYQWQWSGYMIIDSESEIKAFTSGWKRLTKARESFPFDAQTFGQWCAMMCAGLGVREYAIATRDGHDNYCHGEWEYGPISKAAALVDAELEVVRKKVLRISDAENAA